MGYNCVVFGCRNSNTGLKQQKTDCKFLNFPLNQKDLTDKWLEKLNLEGWTPGPESLICEEHFSLDSFEIVADKKVLKPESVPNIVDGLDRILLQYEMILNNHGEQHDSDSSRNKDIRCRICATFTMPQDAIDIYNGDEKVIVKILTCIPILMKTEDYLPKYICRMCLSDLNTSYRMLIRAIESEKFFNNLLNSEQKPDGLIVEETAENEKLTALDTQSICVACNVHFEDINDLSVHIQEKHDPKFDFVEKEIESIDIRKLEHDMYAVVEVRNTVEHFPKHDNVCDTPLSSSSSTLHANNLHDLPIIETDISECQEIESEDVCAVFVCRYCNTAYENIETLNKHLETHIVPVWHEDGVKEDQIKNSENTTNICQVCSAVFPQHSELVKHNREVHNVRSIGAVEKYTCEECGKTFKSRMNFTIHERVHTGARPYICGDCGSSFRSRANLIQHNLVHSGEKRYKCSICDKAFARKGFVETHMRVHTGERPYKCDICEYRFTQIGDMRRHRKRHNMKIEKKPKAKARKRSEATSQDNIDTDGYHSVSGLICANDFIDVSSSAMASRKPQSRNDHAQLISDKNQLPISLSPLISNNSLVKLRIARDAADFRKILVELQQ